MSNINLATAMNMPDGTKVYFEDSTVRDIICNEYDSAETYTKGEYCRYNNTLYECTTTIGTPEVWTPAHWTPTNVGNELTSVSASLTNLNYFVLKRLTSSDTILNTVVGAPVGFSFYECQQATDNPSGSNVGMLIVLKLNASSTYSQMWVFSSTRIYRGSFGSSVPASISWSQIV